jgi:hypothetical protein
MNVKNRKTLLAVAALALSSTVWAQQPEQPVRVKVDGLPPHIANEVKEKAQQGPTELRRYIERTRMIHELNYNSLVLEEPSAALAKKDSDAKMASSKPAARK